MLALYTPIFLILFVFTFFILLLFRKWWLSLIVFLVVVLLNRQTETFALNLCTNRSEDEQPLTILTFNMHSQGGYMDLNRENPHELVELLQTQKADIILLQEYDSLRCRSLRDSLLVTHPFSHYTTSVMSYGQNAIFSRYKIEDIKLHAGHDLINIYKVWLDKKPIVIVNCHLQSNNIGEKIILYGGNPSWLDNMWKYVSSIEKSANTRKKEACYIRSIADSCLMASLPVVVSGDMNDVGGSTSIRTIEGKGSNKLKDAWWQCGSGMGYTYHDYKWLYFRLDHVFYSKHFIVQESNVIEQSFSDHKILLTKLKIR